MDKRLRSRSGEQGAVLVTALFLMLAVLAIGVSAARSTLNAAKSARLERDRHVAFSAAQAALADAERDIEAAPGTPRAAAVSPAAFVGGCGRGVADLGLCLAMAAPAVPVWQAVDLADGDTVPYGHYTGAVMPVAGGLLPAQLPRYLIELVAPAGAQPTWGSFFRITAIGFGSRATTRVVLQSYYRKPAPTPAPALPAGRIGWREIANWPELHADASS